MLSSVVLDMGFRRVYFVARQSIPHHVIKWRTNNNGHMQPQTSRYNITEHRISLDHWREFLSVPALEFPSMRCSPEYDVYLSQTTDYKNSQTM
jgi:hypothetical protein